jgi:hypothetical protein
LSDNVYGTQAEDAARAPPPSTRCTPDPLGEIWDYVGGVIDVRSSS